MNKYVQIFSATIIFIVILIHLIPDQAKPAVELEQLLPALTGGFGEENCYSCHFDGPLNSPRGKVSIKNLPDRFESEREYELSLHIEHDTMLNAGFQLAARLSNGEQAGSFAATDEHTTVNTYEGIQYVQHTYAGTSLASDNENIWQFIWIAPFADQADTVYFHISAVAGNGDKTRHGDDVFERTLVIISNNK